MEIGTAGSVSLISNIHWKSGYPVSLISNLDRPKISSPPAGAAAHHKTKETGTKVLNGNKVGSELSTNNYGGQEWWLLLEPMAT